MYYFVEIACVVAELFICDLFFGSLFKLKRDNKRFSVLCYSCFSVIILALSFIENAVLMRLACSVIGFAIIILLLYQCSIFSAVFASLSFMTIYALTDVIVAASFTPFGIKPQELFVSTSVRSLYVITTHLVFLAAIVILSIFNKNKKGAISCRSFITALPGLLSSLTLCGALFVQSYFSKIAIHPVYIIIILGLLYTNILIIIFVNRIREQDRLKHETDLMEHHYAIEKEYYEQFYAQKEQTRALWHDISKYMRAMQALVSESDSKEAEKNFIQAQALVNEINGVVDVSNRVVSVILNEYMNLANNEGIALRLDVNIPPEIFVTAADLYVMLGNTLDNAIDACSELDEDERCISLQLKMHNNLLHYRIENPYVKEHLLKKRIGVHGYGLRNVERCAEKYGGFVQKSSEGNMFVVNVTLNKV